VVEFECYLDHIAIHSGIANKSNNEEECEMKKLAFALLASIAAVSAAQAQTVDTQPRAYVGVGVATADHEDSNGLDNDGYKASGKVFAGYEFNRTWGAEVGYTDFRKSSVNSATNSGDTKGYGYYVAAKASTPLNDQLSLYGKLGVAQSQRELRTTLVDLKQNDTGAYAGVGLQYNLNQQVALTAEYERYGKSKDFGAKPDVLTVGARYSF
jgi:opacity protein-like surface antigen